MQRKGEPVTRRLVALTLLCLPLLALACGGQTATSTPANVAGNTPTSTALATATLIPALTPTAAAATAAATVAAVTATRAFTAVPATAATSPGASIATPQGTATRAIASAVAGTPVPNVQPTLSPLVPLGAKPEGWKTYTGSARAPFSLYYPPDWTVDESRANEGRVYFYAPGVTQPFEDALWVLIATTGRPEPGGNIDVLRDQYFTAEIKRVHPEAGIDVTRNNTFARITFASLGSTFDVDNRLCYAYIGLGLRDQVPWRFRLNSLYDDYSRRLDSVFAPMIGSLNIYANP
jgi:hypothetical protein